MSVPPDRHELSFCALYFWWEGPSASYEESQFEERIIGKGLDPDSGTIPTNGTQFCALLATSSILFEIEQALGW